MKKAWTLLAGFVAIIVLDSLWLGFVASGFYAEQLAHLMVRTWLAAGVLVWLLLAFGVYYFALPKAKSARCALWYGGLFGFITYGVYDLTNYTFLDWPLRVVIVDVVWGTLLCAFLCWLMFRVQKIK